MSGAWDAVAGLLGFGPDGNDHGSSNWAAWGHPEIYSMVHDSVDPGDIHEAAQAWRDQARNDEAIVTRLTQDLRQTVSGGWRGASADAALAPLAAVKRWSADHTEVADHTARLMADSGSSAAQAKASLPPPRSHSWGESLLSFAAAGPGGALVDAVMQEKEQSDAHAEAVRIMNNVYSAPINDNRAAVPTYLQLEDPTQRSPDQVLSTGPAPVIPHSGAGLDAHGGGHAAGAAPAAAALQGVTGSGIPAPHGGGPVAPNLPLAGSPHGGGQTAAAVAAAGAPVMPEAVDGSTARRARAPGSGLHLGGVGGPSAGGSGHLTGAGHAGAFGPRPSGTGHSGAFGPRPSAPAAEAAESRAGGLGRGTGGPAAGRAGPGQLMPPMGAGGGKRGEDVEHQRPSYLIEMDDIFSDGRRVAPAVIGEDPGGSS